MNKEISREKGFFEDFYNSFNEDDIYSFMFFLCVAFS